MIAQRPLAMVCLLSAALAPLIAPAQVPTLINYQGRLLDGTNLFNGTVNMELTLYNSPTGGGFQYVDTGSVVVVDGLYSTFLGDGTSLGTLTNALVQTNVYLEVTVNGITLTPRERLASVAYAVRSARAESFGGTVLDSQLSTNVARLSGASQEFSGPVSFTGASNEFAGAFSGDGSALTNAAGWVRDFNNLYYTNGNVGIGTNVPRGRLHLHRDWEGGNGGALTLSGDIPSLRLGDGSGLPGPQVWLIQVSNGLHFVRYGWGYEYHMTVLSNGFVGIGTTTPTGMLHVAGNAYATAFLPTSDRNAKENIAPIDQQAVLEKVAALPLAQWNFKTEPGVVHLGPMAQDFHAAFGLGPNDTTIPTVDADGVSLAAIQALYRLVEEQRAELDAQRTRIEELEKSTRP